MFFYIFDNIIFRQHKPSVGSSIGDKCCLSGALTALGLKGPKTGGVFRHKVFLLGRMIPNYEGPRDLEDLEGLRRVETKLWFEFLLFDGAKHG